jgi:hypothetical protein
MKLTDIIELNKMVSRDLFLLGNERTGVDSVFSPFLVYPDLRSKNLPFRLSEQETRMLYIRKLNELGLYHSVETPTTGVYSFTGSKEISANIDLTIFEDKRGNDNNKNNIDLNALKRDVNVEFKSANCDEKNIKKDMEKFAGEGVPGNWFHVLRNVNSGTFSSLFSKFVASMVPFIKQPPITIEQQKFIFKQKIVFCFAVVEKKFSIIKVFDPLVVETKNDLIKFFEFTITAHNGWDVYS